MCTLPTLNPITTQPPRSTHTKPIVMQRRGNSIVGKAGAALALSVLLLLSVAVHTATAFLFPSAPAGTTANSNAAMLPRQRFTTTTTVAAAAKRGGKGYGSGSGGAGSASGGPTGVDGRSLRGFTKVLADGGELGAAANSQKAVGPFSVGGEEKFLLLVRRQGGAVSAIDANCGRCKFPLLNGKVMEDASIDKEEEDREVISCPLCAVTHSLADGRVTGAQASGMLQRVSASFFSKQIATGLKAYPAVGGSDGGVYVQLR